MPKRPPWRLELCESRCLLSGTSLPALNEAADAPDTLDQAQQIGTLLANRPTTVTGVIGDSSAAAADVDWYQFRLDGPARLRLRALSQETGFLTCLGLYNDDTGNYGDPFTPTRHRLLAQQEGSTANPHALLDTLLGAGTYYLAVSGAGNRDFHPYLANSGQWGSTGEYQVEVETAPISTGIDGGPAVLRTEPAAGAVLAGSPFALRVSFASSLDPATFSFDSTVAGQTIQLSRSTNARFTSPQAVPLAWVNFSSTINELEIAPAAALAPGYYRLTLLGNSRLHADVLRDLDGRPLGQNERMGWGADRVVAFRILGSPIATEMGGVADDTVATAHDLGTLDPALPVVVRGAIGDDAAYDPAAEEPSFTNRAADVDLYHFRVSASGPFALIAEGFAGRIGSPLDPALTLFRAGPNGQLTAVAYCDNALNPTRASNDSVPLFTDPVLFAGLTEGDYYLAVSSSGNLIDPLQGLVPGDGQVFDPTHSHSGQLGFSTGAYALRLAIRADADPPEVVAVTFDAAAAAGPPGRIHVHFSEPVQLAGLGSSLQAPSGGGLPVVFVRAADGTDYCPRLEGMTNDGHDATFLLLDPLPNGPAELHLSGSLGLTDQAGHALTGNDSSGDFVYRFDVTGPARGSVDDPLLWRFEGAAAAGAPWELGLLFPHELTRGVTIDRSGTASAAATTDAYRFGVLRPGRYAFLLPGSESTSLRLVIRDADGAPVTTFSQQGGRVRAAELQSGTYTVLVSGWDPGTAPVYRLRITSVASSEDPVPLTSGPAPAYRLRLALDPIPAVAALAPAAAPNVAPPPPPVEGNPLPSSQPRRLVLPTTLGPAMAIIPAVADFPGGRPALNAQSAIEGSWFALQERPLGGILRGASRGVTSPLRLMNLPAAPGEAVLPGDILEEDAVPRRQPIRPKVAPAEAPAWMNDLEDVDSPHEAQARLDCLFRDLDLRLETDALRPVIGHPLPRLTVLTCIGLLAVASLMGRRLAENRDRPRHGLLDPEAPCRSG